MNLDNILKDLQKYKHTNKDELLEQYIQCRLTSSVQLYYNELDKSLKYLQNRPNEVRMMKKINKIKEEENGN